MDNFDSAVAYTLVNEGGYSNVPEDSGGPTNFGITQSDLSEWLGYGASAEDVENMSVDTAKAIYEARYWNPNALEQVKNSSIATAIFDTGVLYGLSTGARYAQFVANVLGCYPQLKIDCVIGPLSLAGINNCDSTRFIRNYRACIISRINEIISNNPSQEIFRNGWTARADRLYTLLQT